MDYTDINYEIEKLQTDMKRIQTLIKDSYKSVFTDNGNSIMTEAAIKNIDLAYENLEQTKALCDVLSDAFEELVKLK